MAAIRRSLLITLEFPPQKGGVASYYENVCRQLPSDKVVVLAPTHSRATAFDQTQGFTIIRDTALNRLAQAGGNKMVTRVTQLLLLSKIKRIIKTHHIKVLQIGNVLPLGSLAYVIKKQKKVPYIVYTHGLDILLPQRSQRKAVVLKQVLKQARGVVANSQFTRELLLNLGVAGERIVVAYPCPNITDTGVSNMMVRDWLSRHHLTNKKIILTVGRLVERKGHDKVIEALPAVLRRIPDAVYVVAGSGPYQENLKLLIGQKKVGHNVLFLGELNEEELKVCYEACDVFVMPSRKIGPDVEGFGTVYLEASLFGKPVIAGKSGGATEAVLNDLTGVTVEPDDTGEIAQAIVKLLTDTAYAQRLSFQAMQRTLEEFTWEKQAVHIKPLLG